MCSLSVHSHILLVIMVMHVLVLIQRLSAIGGMDDVVGMVIIDAGTGISGVGFIIAIVNFILFAIKKARKKVPKMVFAALVIFTAVFDLCSTICFVVFCAKDVPPNARWMGVGLLVTNGVTLIAEILVIVLFFVCKPEGVRSHRPVDDEDEAKKKANADKKGKDNNKKPPYPMIPPNPQNPENPQNHPNNLIPPPPMNPKMMKKQN